MLRIPALLATLEPEAVGSPPEVWRRSDHLSARLRDDVIRFVPRCAYAFFQEEGFDARDHVLLEDLVVVGSPRFDVGRLPHATVAMPMVGPHLLGLVAAIPRRLLQLIAHLCDGLHLHSWLDVFAQRLAYANAGLDQFLLLFRRITAAYDRATRIEPITLPDRAIDPGPHHVALFRRVEAVAIDRRALEEFERVAVRDGNAVIVATLADNLGGTYRGCLGLGLAFDQGLKKPVEASGDDLPALAKALELARALDAANIADEIVLRNEFDTGRLLLELLHVFGRQEIGADEGHPAFDLVLSQPFADTFCNLPVPRHLVRRDDVEPGLAGLVGAEMRHAVLRHEHGGKCPSPPPYPIWLLSLVGPVALCYRQCFSWAFGGSSRLRPPLRRVVVRGLLPPL